MDSLRVLLIEDSASDAKLILAELEKAALCVELERVQTADAMRAALGRKVWDIVICDWSMPAFSAPEAIRILKALELDLPFIIVSGTIGEDSAVDAMLAGADDYVVKDKLGRLVPAVVRELREFEARAVHRKSIEALQASEKRFSRLARSGLMGITVSDLTGEIFEANETFLRMVGFSREEMIGNRLRWRDLTAPEWQAATARSVEQLITSGVATPYEKEYIRKDGGQVRVLVGSAMLDETRTIAFMVDLTAQKRVEEALAKSEEQLRQSQKMEAVGRLAGGIAHDFNNVLSVILSLSEMLVEDMQPDDPIREDIEQIEMAAKRAAALTRQLLMFSRQQALDTKIVDLNELLVGMDKMLRQLLGADVDFASLPGAELGRVRVDPCGIEQVIMNLVVNARDAMPKGGKLTMETRNVVLDEAYALNHHGTKPGPHVMLAVTDSGVGMTKTTMARIFDPFFTTKEIGKGTGLGLSTVFGIAHQSGGSVWVYSEVDRGTTFKVYLPRVDEVSDVARAVETHRSLRGTETILLVEDDDQVRAVARDILHRSGYVVIEASNASDAFRHSEEYEGLIHLLVTDVVMPQMSGPEMAKRLAETRPEMKVLCMSGYTDDSIVRHGVLDAKVAYLQKPLTPDSLTTKVREVLESSRPQVAFELPGELGTI